MQSAVATQVILITQRSRVQIPPPQPLTKIGSQNVTKFCDPFISRRTSPLSALHNSIGKLAAFASLAPSGYVRVSHSSSWRTSRYAGRTRAGAIAERVQEVACGSFSCAQSAREGTGKPGAGLGH